MPAIELLRRCSESAAARVSGAPAAIAALGQAVERARSAWPDIAVAPDVFAAYLVERLPPDGDPAEAVALVHAEDLYLACACANGDARALAAFDKTLLPPIADYVRSTLSDGADEVRQMIRTKLLVGDGASRPKIETYAGRGALGGWLRLVAVRAARDLVRAQSKHVELDADALHASDPDPELDYLKSHYAKAFRAAFAAAVEELSAQDKNVLSLYFLDGMTSDAIAALYKVDGSTIRRRLATVREAILRETRKKLKDELGVRVDELESVMALVQSRLEASVSRLLRGHGSPTK